jgi:hypothetical protein
VLLNLAFFDPCQNVAAAVHDATAKPEAPWSGTDVAPISNRGSWSAGDSHDLRGRQQVVVLCVGGGHLVS